MGEGQGWQEEYLVEPYSDRSGLLIHQLIFVSDILGFTSPASFFKGDSTVGNPVDHNLHC